MTANQDRLYWREWGALSRHCKAAARPVPDRHALHEQALGYSKSHKLFTNSEFDRVLGAFRAVCMPDAVAPQLRQLDQPRARKMAKVQELLTCLGLYLDDAPAYAREIIRDKVDHGSWRNVTEIADLSDAPPHPDRPSQLEQLVMTLEARLNGKTGFRAKAFDSVHDMRTRAGLKCPCKNCGQPKPVPTMVADPEPESVEVDQPF